MAAHAGLGAPEPSEPYVAALEKVRGNVTEQGGAISLRTGDVVSPGHAVTVGRLSVAVYKIGEEYMLKEAPRTTMTFNGVSRTQGQGPRYPLCAVDVQLQTGDLYSAMKEPKEGSMDYRITTSRMQANAHLAVFRVSHAFSTSIVYVKDGEVEVLYCYLSKRVVVHAGEVFVVKDCEGILRWQTDEESRDMTLFAALTNAGFSTEMAMLEMPLAVLAPRIPVNLPGSLAGLTSTPTAVLAPTVPPNLPVVSP